MSNMHVRAEISSQLERTGFMWCYTSEERIVLRSAHGHEYRFESPKDVLTFLVDINTDSGSIDLAKAMRTIELAERQHFPNLPVIVSQRSDLVNGYFLMHSEYMADIPHSDHALILRTTSISVSEATGTTREYYLQDRNQRRSRIFPTELETSRADRIRDEWIDAEDVGFEIVSGYRIIRRESNIVAGHNPRAPEQFVTWSGAWDAVKDAPDYRWGRYTNSYHRVLGDLQERAGNGYDAWRSKHDDSVVDVSNEMFYLEDYNSLTDQSFVDVFEVDEIDLRRYKVRLEKEIRAADEFLMDDTESLGSFVAYVEGKEYITPVEALPNYKVVMHLITRGFCQYGVRGAPFYRCEDKKYFFVELPNGKREPLDTREEMSRLLDLEEHNIPKPSARLIKIHDDELER